MRVCLLARLRAVTKRRRCVQSRRHVDLPTYARFLAELDPSAGFIDPKRQNDFAQLEDVGRDGFLGRCVPTLCFPVRLGGVS